MTLSAAPPNYSVNDLLWAILQQSGGSPMVAPARWSSNDMLWSILAGGGVGGGGGGVETTRIVTSNYTLTAADLEGGVIYVTGSAILTIPPVTAGAAFSVITIGDVAVSVDPNAADLIYLNGVPQADGEKISNTSTTADMAVFTYYDATGWVAMTSPGWTNGG